MKLPKKIIERLIREVLLEANIPSKTSTRSRTLQKDIDTDPLNVSDIDGEDLDLSDASELDSQGSSVSRRNFLKGAATVAAVAGAASYGMKGSSSSGGIDYATMLIASGFDEEVINRTEGDYGVYEYWAKITKVNGLNVRVLVFVEIVHETNDITFSGSLTIADGKARDQFWMKTRHEEFKDVEDVIEWVDGDGFEMFRNDLDKSYQKAKKHYSEPYMERNTQFVNEDGNDFDEDMGIPHVWNAIASWLSSYHPSFGIRSLEDLTTLRYSVGEGNEGFGDISDTVKSKKKIGDIFADGSHDRKSRANGIAAHHVVLGKINGKKIIEFTSSENVSYILFIE